MKFCKRLIYVGPRFKNFILHKYYESFQNEYAQHA